LFAWVQTSNPGQKPEMKVDPKLNDSALDPANYSGFLCTLTYNNDSKADLHELAVDF
jgi:hypothetical protein